MVLCGTSSLSKSQSAFTHGGRRRRRRSYSKESRTAVAASGAEGAQLAPGIIWRHLPTRKQTKTLRIHAIGKRRCGVARLSSILDRLVKEFLACRNSVVDEPWAEFLESRSPKLLQDARGECSGLWVRGALKAHPQQKCKRGILTTNRLYLAQSQLRNS